MTKNEYLNALKERLRNYPFDLRKEVLDAFEGHFEEGLNSGETEEEIIESLGTVDEVMENIRMMQLGEERRYDSSEELRNGINQLSSSLKNTILGVTSFVSDTVNNAVKDFNDTLEAEKKAEAEGFIEVKEGTVLRIKGNTGALDIFLENGNRLEYHFEPTLSLFSNTVANLRLSENEHRITMESTASAHLHIKVPEEIESIDIALASGDVEIDNLNTGDLMIRTISGDIEIDKAAFQRLSINSKSGDIDIDSTSFANADLSTMSGDITLSKTEGNLKADTASGDLEADEHRGDLVYLEAVSGDISANLIASEIELVSVSGDLEFMSDGRIESVSARTTSGDITAEIKDHDYTAVLSTLSGSLSNDTELERIKRSRREWTVGNGLASVYLKSSSGDVSLV